MDLIKQKDLAMLNGSKDKIQNILDLLDQIGKTNTIDNKELKYSLQELSLIMDSAIDIFKVKTLKNKSRPKHVWRLDLLHYYLLEK